jgi:hypothetical protein
MTLQRAGGHHEDRHRGLLTVVDVRVDTHDPPLPAIELALESICGVGDLALGVTLLDRLDHAPAAIDLVQISPHLALGFVGEALDEPRSAEGVHGVRGARLLGDDLLLSEREEGGFRCRDRKGLVERVGVE